jgi:hypothetical protein
MSTHFIVKPLSATSFAVVGNDGERFCTTDSFEDATRIVNALNAPQLVGTFVPLHEAANPQPANRPDNPFAQLQAAYVLEIARLVVPTIGVNPHPEEFEDAADYLRRFVAVGDRFLKAFGEEISRKATVSMDMTAFEDAFLGAVDGFATFEIDKAASALREELAEAEIEIARNGRSNDFADELFKTLQRAHRAMQGSN